MLACGPDRANRRFHSYVEGMRRFITLFLLVFAVLLGGAPALAQEQAEGQGKADYHAWLAREPAARAQLLAFKQFLEMEKVDEVLPTWPLVRTASMWSECTGPRFEVAPFTEWQHISTTLGFIKAQLAKAK